MIEMTQPDTPEGAGTRLPGTRPSRKGRVAANSPPAEQARGYEQEFASFYREYTGRLVTYVIYQGTPAHIAAELAQEAMITAYQRWTNIKYPKAYVYKVAYQAYIRHATRVTELPVDDVPEPTGVLPHPEDAEIWLQNQQIIDVLRALPARQRQVLALSLDGWSPARSPTCSASIARRHGLNSQEPIDRWLADQHIEVRNGSGRLLDLDAGLREVTLHVEHADVLGGISGSLDIEAGLNAVLPESVAPESPSSVPYPGSGKSDVVAAIKNVDPAVRMAWPISISAAST